MGAPLQQYLVIDMTVGDSGPFCTMQLGDGGADVIKVEPLEGDRARMIGPPSVDDDSGFFLGLNRNKRSLAIDYRTAEGRAVLLKLAERADIFVESFQPGVIDELGLGYAALSERNPGLVYCSISAFDQEGPYAQKPATDLIVQGLSGIQRFVGVIGREPVKFGTNYAGVVADMYAVQAILAALFHRKRSGEGQKVETSMLRAMIATQTNYFTADSNPDEDLSAGFRTMHLAPPATGYKTKDLPMFFSFSYARHERAWERFCESVGIPEAVFNDPRFATEPQRAAHEEELKATYEQAFEDLTADDVWQRLVAVDAIASPHYPHERVFSDPNILAQGVLQEVEHPTRGTQKTFGLPWKLTKTPGSVRLAAPRLGEHTEEILATFGYTAEQVDGLKQARIIF